MPELDKLITAIEAYHAKFNQYPPDNFDPVAKTVNPVTNSLYYELTGVIADDRGGGRFRLANRQQWIGTQQVQQYFHTDGFVNSGTSAKEIKQFAEFKAEQHKAIASMPADLEVLTVPVDWPLNNPKFPAPFAFNLIVRSAATFGRLFATANPSCGGSILAVINRLSILFSPTTK